MRALRFLSFLLLIASLVLVVFSYGKISDLPAKEELVDLVYKQPVQEEVDLSLEPFGVVEQGFAYTMTPRYHYEISGVMVADYKPDSWINLFSRKDPLYKRNICLIWGYNAQSGNYEDGRLYYADGSCMWKPKEEVIFNSNEMSMNQLLPSSKKIEDLIKTAEIGDQVRIKGYLVNYHVVGLDTNFFINSSSSRDDRAFEVIYVTEFEILKEVNIGYKLLYRISKYIFFFFLVVFIVISFIYISRKPAIRKKEIVPELDSDPMRQKNFPSVFSDKD